MDPQGVTAEPTRHQPPVDPEFLLDAAYRDQLTELGEAQYEAARRGNRRRVDRLRSQLVEDTPVGSGVGRVVYPLPASAYSGGRYDGYVVKLPRPDHHDQYGYDRDGRTQNRAEASLWERNPTRWLVPVVAAERRGQWLVMPRGQSVADGADWLADWTAALTEAHDLVSAQGHDLEAQNVVLLEGQPRLCDYGALAG